MLVRQRGNAVLGQLIVQRETMLHAVPNGGAAHRGIVILERGEDPRIRGGGGERSCDSSTRP